MITCSACNYAQNPDNALVCAKCGQPLTDARASLLRKPTGLLVPEILALESRSRTQHVGKMKRYDVAIYVSDLEEPLIVSLMRDILLGRYGGSEQQPPIDLAAFEGLEHGVSRKHAMLRRFGPDVTIVDLGSTNGTWLNGVRVQPHQPVTLR